VPDHGSFDGEDDGPPSSLLDLVVGVEGGAFSGHGLRLIKRQVELTGRHLGRVEREALA
jgi:hypothetical protein